MKLTEVVVPFPNRKGEVKKEKRDELIAKLQGVAAELPAAFDAQRETEAVVAKKVHELKTKYAQKRKRIAMAIRPLMKEYVSSVDPVSVLYYSADESKLARDYIDSNIDSIIADLHEEVDEIQQLSKFVRENLASKVVAPQYLWRDTGLDSYSFDMHRQVEWFEEYKRKMQA